MDVHTWRHDLVEIGYSFTHHVIRHCNHITRVPLMAKNFLLVLPKARVAFGLYVGYTMLSIGKDVSLSHIDKKRVYDSDDEKKSV